jgi:hypothetical protein
MLRWENGLFGGKLLTPASLRKMTTPFKNDYACGLYVHRVNGRVLIDYDGNNIGFNAQMAYYPDDGLGVIVLANLNGYVTGRINTALAAVSAWRGRGLCSAADGNCLTEGGVDTVYGDLRIPG